MITELEFQSLATEGYNRIPLISEAFADLETPLSLYLKLCAGAGQGRNSFLLESVVGGEGGFDSRLAASDIRALFED